VPTNRYNGKPASLETISAGTTLYRIYPSTATYAANSFNPTPRALGDPRQGRFEPVDAALGGYLYAAPSLAGAVAEGILRNVAIPRSGLVRRAWLVDKRLAVLELLQDVPVASVHGPHAARLNLDSGLLCCDWKGYSRTRRVGTRILLKSPDAQGIRYRCRNNDDETSLMFVDRGAVVKIAVRNQWHILADAKGRKLVLDTLDHHLGLGYTGNIP